MRVSLPPSAPLPSGSVQSVDSVPSALEVRKIAGTFGDNLLWIIRGDVFLLMD